MLRFAGIPARSLAALLLVGIGVAGCATRSPQSGPGSAEPPAKSPVPNPEFYAERWGIEIVGLRLTAADHLLNFRYRILDPDKAQPLVDRRNKPLLIDPKTGRAGAVPVPGKLGPMRATQKFGKPKVDRVYWVIFQNPGAIRRGDTMTVSIGEFRADLVVE